MEIAFHSGGIYQYDGVPANVHQGLISASSKGKYFHQYIKNVYPYRKVR
nr:KTSC domain-containing protein [Xenorhabdus sp. BG5]